MNTCMYICIFLFHIQLQATDEDSDSFGKVTYSITSGDSNVFYINNTSGDLFVSGFTDRETTDSYTLTVTGRDGGMTT